ncbi:MAG: efflux RND transporter periplasmic adaptor subunit [Deltaproteobacteria bacterium]|nr:efflux RND transporter periplasmic adaptor subunit [Deltaproteobacteria bacterium]
MKKRIIIVVIFFVLLIGVGSFVYYGQWKNKHKELYFSGTIEAIQSNLAFQAAGRVLQVAVNEGQHVGKDEVLAELDRAEFQSRYDQAKATLDRSLKTREQISTMLEIYKKTLPAEVARAEAAVASARYVMDDAKKNNGRYEQLFQRGVVSEKERDAVKLGYETAMSRLAEGEAVLRQVRSNLKKIQAGRQDVEAARSQVQATRAALDQTSIQMGYTQLKSPFSGTITSRNVEPGEVVTPGREVLTLADLSRVNLKIFVDETEIGKVKLGQKVEVMVDTFPGKVYKGYVSFVSSEGEFTPKIIQTRKERVKLVYLVKVFLPNPDLELKSGMPADAWLR